MHRCKTSSWIAVKSMYLNHPQKTWIVQQWNSCLCEEQVPISMNGITTVWYVFFAFSLMTQHEGKQCLKAMADLDRIFFRWPHWFLVGTMTMKSPKQVEQRISIFKGRSTYWKFWKYNPAFGYAVVRKHSKKLHLYKFYAYLYAVPIVPYCT